MAKIATEKDQALDIFDMRNEKGDALSEAGRSELERGLLGELSR